MTREKKSSRCGEGGGFGRGHVERGRRRGTRPRAWCDAFRRSGGRLLRHRARWRPVRGARRSHGKAGTAPRRRMRTHRAMLAEAPRDVHESKDAMTLLVPHSTTMPPGERTRREASQARAGTSPRRVEACRQQVAGRAMRRRYAFSATSISKRDRTAPRQKCRPPPNAR